MGATLNTIGDSLLKTSLSGRKEIILTTKTTPLPIELLSFKGSDRGAYNLLEWATATEINNDFFTLESSQNAFNWNTINITPGAGNSNEQLYYQYKDYNYHTPLTYYRLKQTDFDGAYSFSNIVAVHKTNNGNVISVYPNPANNVIYFDFFDLKTENFTIRITNTIGQILTEISITSNKMKIDFSGYSKGVYFMQVVENNQLVAIEKIAKQ